MRDQQPIRSAVRKAGQQKRERRGIAVPPCVLCIEEHHTAGRHQDSQLTDPLCQKHHREIHEQWRRAGISPLFEPDPLKRVATALRAAALYDRARAEAMERWATVLEKSKEDRQ